MIQKHNLIFNLNNPKKRIRLSSLKKLKKLENDDKTLIPEKRYDDTSLQIHTFYSFSPYSPSKAAYMAYRSGLVTMGIADHDTLSGANEFIKACRILNRAQTIGFECRVHFSLNGNEEFYNNKAQKNSVYLMIQGVPVRYIKKANSYLASLREKRNLRNRKMVDIINAAYHKNGISIDFEKEILPLSKVKEGGSITERHLLFVLGKKLIKKFGKGEQIYNLLLSKDYEFSPMQKDLIIDENNPYYEYDLLDVLKKNIKTFYIAATDECEDMKDIISFSKKIGAIVCYPYYGSENEEKNIDLFFSVLKGKGVQAVSYSVNKLKNEQIKLVHESCVKYDLFEINRYSINSPRQKFKNFELENNPDYSYLIDSAWAIIGHQKMANLDINNGMFTQKAIGRSPKLKDRINLYKQIGKSGYNL